MILGHEFVGTIEAVKPLPPPAASPVFPLNTRVVAEINCCSPSAPGVSCSTWRSRAQDPNRTALGIFGSDGCFATHVVVPLINLHRVPDCIADKDAVFTEPLAAAAAVAEEIHVRPSDKVGVLGSGRLGILIAAALSAARIDVVLLARDTGGRGAAAARKVACGRPLTIQKSADSGGEETFDVIVEATGRPAGLQRALKLVRPRGTIVLKSTYAVGRVSDESDEVDMALVVVKEITLKGSRCGHFPTALKMLEDELVRPDCMVEKVFALSDAKEAFDFTRKKGSLKVLFEPGR